MVIIKLVDKLISPFLIESIRDEALGDLWEAHHKLEAKKLSAILCNILTIFRAILLIWASLQIKFLEMKYQFKQELEPNLPTQRVLNFPITALPLDDQIQTILRWAKTNVSKTVCVANVNMLMEAHWNPDFVTALKSADIVTPGDMPLVWMMRKLRARYQARVTGMDIMISLCKLASANSVSVFYLGSQSEILSRMRKRLNKEFPELKIAAMEALPFRPLTVAEDEALIKKINESGAGIVFVSLGCPKQEKWMEQHKNKIHGVMIGLGEVFWVYAGIHKRPPRVVRDLGLEWLYRPWLRYKRTIPALMWLASKQLLSSSSLNTLFHIREGQAGQEKST